MLTRKFLYRKALIPRTAMLNPGLFLLLTGLFFSRFALAVGMAVLLCG